MLPWHILPASSDLYFRGFLILITFNRLCHPKFLRSCLCLKMFSLWSILWQRVPVRYMLYEETFAFVSFHMDHKKSSFLFSPRVFQNLSSCYSHSSGQFDSVGPAETHRRAHKFSSTKSPYRVMIFFFHLQIVKDVLASIESVRNTDILRWYSVWCNRIDAGFTGAAVDLQWYKWGTICIEEYGCMNCLSFMSICETSLYMHRMPAGIMWDSICFTKV